MLFGLWCGSTLWELVVEKSNLSGGQEVRERGRGRREKREEEWSLIIAFRRTHLKPLL